MSSICLPNFLTCVHFLPSFANCFVKFRFPRVAKSLPNQSAEGTIPCEGLQPPLKIGPWKEAAPHTLSSELGHHTAEQKLWKIATLTESKVATNQSARYMSQICPGSNAARMCPFLYIGLPGAVSAGPSLYNVKVPSHASAYPQSFQMRSRIACAN